MPGGGREAEDQQMFLIQLIISAVRPQSELASKLLEDNGIFWALLIFSTKDEL